MKISTYKIEQPIITEIKLDYTDIAEWFKTAKTSEIQYAINEIGRVLSEIEDDLPFGNDIRCGISGKVSPQSKGFWKSLIKAME